MRATHPTGPPRLRAPLRDRIRALRHRIDARDGLRVSVQVETDYDPASNTDIPEIQAWEEEGIRAGELTAYVVATMRPAPPCERCAQEIPADIADAVGAVVADAGLEGSYGHPYLIPDPYVRWIASEMYRGALTCVRRVTGQ